MRYLVIYMQDNYWNFLKLRDKINLLKHKKPITTPKNFIALILKEKQRVLDIGAGDKRLLKYFLCLIFSAFCPFLRTTLSGFFYDKF